MRRMTTKVLVSGSGKMGREVLEAVCREDDMDAVGCVDYLSTEEFISIRGSELIPFGTDAAAMIARVRPDVIVDFTNAEWTPRLAKEALEAGVRLIIGTTGLSDAFLRELEADANKRGVGVLVAPNFAMGAVLMECMARIASRYFSHAEIIELHHDGKVDAPSGTSLATARAMAEGRGQPFISPTPKRQALAGTRGGQEDGVNIHSVRLPGLVAHQEVIFGAPGETLTIRHDTSHRESFMPGVIMAIREVIKRNDYTYGLDRLLGLT
jgi:4-hydroxy-tetrahydrodipicolinate reductase